MTRWPAELARELREGRPCMLVTVAAVEGSAPREPGARVIVTEDRIAGTIGGGQLEFEAVAHARGALSDGAGFDVRRYPLGPELGQCCGGVVHLVFEPFSPADAAWVEQLAQPGRRLRVLEWADGAYTRRSVSGEEEAQYAGIRFKVDLQGGKGRLVERMEDTRQPVWVFGAGHVGRALVTALAPLDFRIAWIDSRRDEFPDTATACASVLSPSMPALMVDEAPPRTAFLVMTHSHALDQDICEAVLRRGDAAYLGLIGSDTKAARFKSRIRARGMPEDALAQLHCPIGLPGIAGKEPEVIAASVAADLLLRFRRANMENGRAERAVEGVSDV